MITVLTPTYNRRHTLKRLFHSLCAQTDMAFEWLLIDDGSTDGTELLVQDWTEGALFPVHYVRQENGGKHVALNTGAYLAKGDWVFIVDSDDALTPDAIAVLRQDIHKNGADDIAGFCYRKTFFDGQLIGRTNHLDDTLYLHPTEAGTVFKGDLAYLFKTSCFRNRPFPVFRGEKFVPELYIWNQIGDDGRILYFTKKGVYLCEYLPDGYSANFSNNLKCNPKGFLIFYKSQFFRERSVFLKIKCLIRVLQCLSYAVANRGRS